MKTHSGLPLQVSDREQKKLNDKQRRLQETAARNKADALRDDDNVFDVSYESQGGAGDAGDTVSATDIKVWSQGLEVLLPRTCCGSHSRACLA